MARRRRRGQPEQVQPPRDPLVVTNRRGQQVDLCDCIAGTDAFLVLGGPSLNTVPRGIFRERGIFSLGLNNAAAHVHTTAFVCSDPPLKFHESIWFDSRMMKFTPNTKRAAGRGQIRMKVDGKFIYAPVIARDCPNVWFCEREREFNPRRSPQ